MKPTVTLLGAVLAVVAGAAVAGGPLCGDGHVEWPIETCDPPGSNPGGPDACRSDCSFCGDGYVNTTWEGCDDGDNEPDPGCWSDCYLPSWVATDGSDETGDGSPDLPFRTIQATFVKARDFSRIFVRPGTYNECVVAGSPVASDRPVKIVAEAWLASRDNTATTISGAGVCDREQPLRDWAPAVVLSSRASRLEGFTITGGGASGVRAAGSVVITNNVITGNRAGYGGGIYFYAGVRSFPGDVEATIANNTLAGNVAEVGPVLGSNQREGGNGGGLFVYAVGVEGDLPSNGDARVVIDGNTIVDNRIGATDTDAAKIHGGGLGVFTTTSPHGTVEVQITNNVIRGNSVTPGAQGYGGGAWLYTYGYGTETIEFRDNTVEANRATQDGGGVSAWLTTFGTRGDGDPDTADTETHHTITLAGNQVRDNMTPANGGGFDLYLFGRNLRDPESASIEATGNVITGNHGDGKRGGGGGVLATAVSWRSRLADSRILLRRNAITGNDARVSGAGVGVLAEADADPPADPYLHPPSAASSDVVLEGNLIAANVASGPDAVGGGLFAFLQSFVDADSRLLIDRTTVVDNSTIAGGGGIHVETYTAHDAPGAAAEAWLDVTNSIVARNDGRGIGGPIPGVEAGVMGPAPGTGKLVVGMRYSDLWGHPAGDHDDWLPDPTGHDGNISVDPDFGPGWVPGACSPTLDAADPAVDYTAEPLPNGGQANLGHTGGTQAATASMPDLNGDASIDGIDVLTLSVAFGTAAGDPRYDLRSDLNRDGWVDGLDLSFVGSEFGGACE